MSKRRPSGDGMVRKREDGRWEGRIVVGHKQNGEPIFRYVLARTQKELLAKLHRDMDLYQDAQLTEDSRMTLGEYLERWMEEYGAVTLRPNTLRSYEQYIRCYVKPYLGGKIISRITRLDIQKLYQKLKKEGRVHDHPEYDVEDTSTVMMRMENGAQFVVQTNFNIPDEAAKWRLEFFGTKGRLLGDTIIGQNDGGVLNAVFIEKNLAYNATQDHNDETGIDLPGEFGNMYTREIDSFSDSILHNKPLEVPASDAVHVQHIMELAYRSGETMQMYEV